MAHTITLLPGDGVGPEVAAATQRVVAAAGVAVNWEVIEAPSVGGRRPGEFPHQAALDSIERNHVGLKGPMGTPIGEGAPSINVALRKELDLYANLRPVQNLEGAPSRWKGVDLVVVRENTEDLYAGLEHVIVPGVVESLKIITDKASTRIARFAFEYARRIGRKKIHAIHKANIMKLSDGMFLSATRRVAKEFADIGYAEMIVDNTCMQLVMNPGQFDMLVLPNLYGDVISDLAAGLVGGLVLVGSGNIGEHAALFEAVHGTAPDIAGRGVANPTALILSAVMMLKYLDEIAASERIERAIARVFREGKSLTHDVGGEGTTEGFTDAVVGALEAEV
jgi:isocitrate dehydrogenase (NAD+)